MKQHNYQEQAVDFWLANPRTYFAVDMGLGKTSIILHALAKLNKPALVIAPLRAAYTTWPDEIIKWKLPLKSVVVHGENKELAIRSKADVYITNFHSIPFIYNSLVDMIKQKWPIPFDICVIDEGSMIKAPKSKRLTYLTALRKVFPKYRAILSGTPAPNSLLDLWSQYTWLCGNDLLGERYGTFRRLYFDADPYNPYTYTIKPKAETQIYKKIAPYTFRLDEKDHIKLPEITYNYLSVSMPKKLRLQYQELKKEFLLKINSIDHIALNAATLSMKLRQFLQGFLYYDTDEIKPNGKPVRGTTELHQLKAERLKELVDETSQPIFCAIQFKHDLTVLRKLFPGVPVIAGGTKNSEANKYIKQWNNKELPLLLCHPVSLSHGVNLQAGGCNIIWYCQTWSLEQYKQLNKRLYRQGQENGVVVHHIVIDKTIDDKITKVLARKDMTQQRLLDYLRDEANYD